VKNKGPCYVSVSIFCLLTSLRPEFFLILSKKTLATYIFLMGLETI
jgi:hypothetical protein